MLWGPLPSEGIVNSVTKPVVVIRPILLPTMQREPGSRMQLASVNHKAPSGPVVMPHGWAWGLGRANSDILPSVVIRPILPLTDSVNHSAPSGPVVIPPALLFSGGIVNSVTAPVVVIRPILPRTYVNHSAPSGPAAISPLLAAGVVSLVTMTVVVIGAILPPIPSMHSDVACSTVVMPNGIAVA